MTHPFSTPMPEFFETMDQYQWRIRYGSAVARFLKDAEMMGREVIEKPPAIADVYVPLKLHEKNLDPIEDKKQLEKESLALPDALATYDRLVISGPPGSGKSTLVRFISYGLGRESITPLAALVGRRFPMPLILRSLRMEKVIDLGSFLDEWLTSFGSNIDFKIERERIHFYLEHGWCVLLFDGVDELGETNRKKLRDRIIYPLCKKYPKNKIVITGRPTGFETCAYDFPKEIKQKRGPSFFVQPFTDEDIESFSKKWFAIREKGKHDAARLHKIFVDALTANQSLREMKYRPVYLTMLAVVHEHQGRLPDGRAEAYRSILDTYIDQLDAVRRLYEEQGRDVVPPWPKEDKKRILERLAYRLHLRGIKKQKGDQRIQVSDVEMKQLLGEILEELNTIPNFALREELKDNPDQLVDQIFNFFVARTGFIAETAHKQYQFSHLSFQEYLTALHIYRSQLEGNNRRNPIAYLTRELSDRMDHDAWHEVGVLFFCHDALEGGGAQDELLDDITPKPVTDGFFEFWVKLLNNHEHQISIGYREKTFEKLAEWVLDLKGIGRLAGLIREYWTELADPNQTILRLFLSNPSDQGHQLGKFLFLLHKNPKIAKKIDWQMVKDQLLQTHFACSTLIFGLDNFNINTLASILSITTVAEIIFLDTDILNCNRSIEVRNGLGLWRFHFRVLFASWLRIVKFKSGDRFIDQTENAADLVKTILTSILIFEGNVNPYGLTGTRTQIWERDRPRELALVQAFDLALAWKLDRTRNHGLALDLLQDHLMDLGNAFALADDLDLTRPRWLALNLDRGKNLSLRKLSEKFFNLLSVIPNLRQTPQVVERANLQVGALLFFWPTEYMGPNLKIKKIQTSLKNLEANYRTEEHTDELWNFFVERHNKFFGSGGDYSFLLDPDFFEPDAEWPPDLEPVIKYWDDTLRENGIPIHEPEPYPDEG